MDDDDGKEKDVKDKINHKSLTLKLKRTLVPGIHSVICNLTHTQKIQHNVLDFQIYLKAI